MNPFLLFLYLQILDALSTTIAINSGAHEANPVTAFAISRLGMVTGLVVVKWVAALAGFICYATKRERILVVSNWAYALVVFSNLIGVVMYGRI